MENKNYQQHRDNNIAHPVDVTKKKTRKISFNFKEFISKKPTKKHLLIMIGAGVFLLGGSIAALQLFGPKAAEPNPEPVVTSTYEPPKPTTEASKLTGVQVPIETNKRPITGVMIENSIDARPQSGLYDAGVVFEAIAEGGITRFLALFQEAQPSYIGPIRSARPYYVNWVAGFDAGYVHSGGSPEALKLIRELGLKDMDHGNNGSYFDRVSNRYAPHNVYTSMERLDALRKEKGYTSSEFTGFERVNNEEKKSDSTPVSTNKKATNIAFEISGPLYNTSYTYDSEKNVYLRKMAGQKHTDEKSGKQISPKVVIALYTDYSIHRDGVHSVYKTIGSGKALIFQNGEAVSAIWTKKNPESNITFTNKKGDTIPLEPGQTWITAIPEGRVSYTP